MEKRFENIESRIDGLSQDVASMKEDITTMKEDITTMKEDITTIKEVISSALIKVDNNFKTVNAGLMHLSGRIDNVAKQVETLKGSTDGGFEVVGDKLDVLTSEISKIGIVTRYEDEWKNLQQFKNN